MPGSHRPALVAIDDDPHVLRAVRRDLTTTYSDRYRILTSTSPLEGLRILDALCERREEPALLLVDQRMPEMSGIEFLAASLDRFPSARRVLLTGYADTAAAIDAINRVNLHHYLVKPWEPPAERLYPVLDEQLADWQASYQPPYPGITIVGYRFAPATHRVRDFLTRLLQPFRFVDVETDAEPVAAAAPQDLPMVLLPDGTSLSRPSNADLMDALGLRGHQPGPHYDLIIIGAGPTGLAAAVYGASEGLSTLLVDAHVPGGQAGSSSRIENYLGFPAGVSGAELTKRAVAQARRFGAEVLAPVEAVALRSAGRARVLVLSDGTEISAGCVLLATGLTYHRLDAPGAADFEGAGIYYGGAAADSTLCANQRVLIVGGANSAGQAALHFAKHAEQVTMIVRADDLAARMSHYLVDEIRHTAKIDVRLRTALEAAEGTDRLTHVRLRDHGTGRLSTEPAAYVFSFIGAQPRTDWLTGVVQRDDNGFVVTGPGLTTADLTGSGWDLPRSPLPLETSVPGIFAAGDVRSGSVKRIASAVGEGAMAVTLIHQYTAVS